jgi:hypothetical protein
VSASSGGVDRNASFSKRHASDAACSIPDRFSQPGQNSRASGDRIAYTFSVAQIAQLVE